MYDTVRRSDGPAQSACRATRPASACLVPRSALGGGGRGRGTTAGRGDDSSCALNRHAQHLDRKFLSARLGNGGIPRRTVASFGRRADAGADGVGGGLTMRLARAPPALQRRGRTASAGDQGQAREPAGGRIELEYAGGVGAAQAKAARRMGNGIRAAMGHGLVTRAPWLQLRRASR